MSLARAALRRTVEHINQQHAADAHAASEERRLRELEALEYETELARKRRVLAEEQARAAGAEEIAAAKAKAAAYEAEAELEKAKRKANLAKERRIDSEVGEDNADAGGSSPRFAAALRSQAERAKIKRDAEAQRRAVFDRAGGDAQTLSDDDRYEIENITEAEQEALKQFDINAAGIRFAPDEESA